MGDFLSNLVSKSRGTVEGVRPRPPALFESTAAGDGLTSQPLRASDGSWRDAQEALPSDSARRRQSEWGPAASLVTRLTTDGEAAPSAGMPHLTSSPDRQRPPRMQGSSLEPPRARSTVSPEGATSEMARRPTESDQPPATPEPHVSASTAPPPGATVPPASKSGVPARAAGRVQPSVTRRTDPTQSAAAPSPAALETDLRRQTRDETGGQYSFGTAQRPSESPVEPARPPSGPSPTTANSDSSPGGPPPSSPEPADEAPRPRVTTRIDPLQLPADTPRQTAATRQPAESAQPYTFPSVEPIVSPSAQPEPVPESPPTIRVTIGHVEVRAIAPPQTETPRPKPTGPDPVLTLDEYLKQRNEESR
jgi:hypothetical protein